MKHKTFYKLSSWNVPRTEGQFMSICHKNTNDWRQLPFWLIWPNSNPPLHPLCLLSVCSVLLVYLLSLCSVSLVWVCVSVFLSLTRIFPLYLSYQNFPRLRLLSTSWLLSANEYHNTPIHICHSVQGNGIEWSNSLKLMVCFSSGSKTDCMGNPKHSMVG